MNMLNTDGKMFRLWKKMKFLKDVKMLLIIIIKSRVGPLEKAQCHLNLQEMFFSPDGHSTSITHEQNLLFWLIIIRRKILHAS